RLWVPPEHVPRYALGRAIPCRVHACRADSASPGLCLIGHWPARNYQKFPARQLGNPTSKEADHELNQGRPVRSVRGLTEAAFAFFLVKRVEGQGTSVLSVLQEIATSGTWIP